MTKNYHIEIQQSLGSDWLRVHSFDNLEDAKDCLEYMIDDYPGIRLKEENNEI
ncbi:hypothetical protein G4Z96_001394 [Listeria monocytogenes]|uniref:hypothetical protein n=1 Tax=Listeria seeligeri TaxID=1640 RepID=UPI001886CAF8|nr:hypothetical protein [Listeria seeligeri]EEN9149170.1 hypothetical protein [Listeria monocytogenes]MBF2653933.1 hypothetical protein [Listeria seeligeri]HDI4304260.1 hypothetical protein [Listeria monocytogenes]